MISNTCTVVAFVSLIIVNVLNSFEFDDFASRLFGVLHKIKAIKYA